MKTLKNLSQIFLAIAYYCVSIVWSYIQIGYYKLLETMDKHAGEAILIGLLISTLIFVIGILNLIYVVATKATL